MITITEKASNYLARLLEKSPIITSERGIRIGVRAGGCHGLKYFIETVPYPDKHDEVMILLGIRIFIDPKSMTIMSNTEIDCSDNLIDPLVFKNPRAKSTCGCGTSFELK